MSTESTFRWRRLVQLIVERTASAQHQAMGQQICWRIPRHRLIFWTCALLMTVGVGVYLRAEIHRRVARFDPPGYSNLVHSGGTLLIAGGGQLSDQIRRRFIELAGGVDARIVVIPAESTDAASRSQYRDAWLHFGVKSVDVLHAESRTESDDPDVSQMLETATGVWLGGGQQTWLTAWYGRTLVETRLKEVLARNGVIAGTSAGAAVMSGVMIAGGRQSPTIGRGFDLIPNAVIDQHFVKRNRFRRLQQVLKEYPELIGFGIDEGTALQYDVETGRFQVLGQSCVVACVFRIDQGDQPNLHLQFLNPGDEFDIERLRRGETVPPGLADWDTVLFGE